MSDEFGGINFPVAAPSGDEPIADPALRYLGEYLQAVLVAQLGTAWAARSPGSGIVPDAHLFYWDPRSGIFDEGRLPALYIFEQSSTTARIADDYWEDRRQLAVWWCADFGQEIIECKRMPIINAIGKVIERALRLERDPAWVVDSDPDSTAASRGSNVFTWGGFTSAKREVMQPLSLDIVLPGADGRQMAIKGCATTIQIQEMSHRDPSTGNYPSKLDAGLSVNEATWIGIERGLS